MISLSPSLSLLAAAAIASAVACGSSASSQPTPIAPPPAGTPVASPVAARPVATAAAATPVAGPSRATPIAGPSRATPIAGPSRATPIAGPSHATPVAGPSGAPPVAGPSGATPIAGPSHATPIAGPASGPSGHAAVMLAAHNAHRARHCAPPLRWSPSIAATAQRYADELAANGCAFRHSRGAYGENLMRFSPVGAHDPAYVVDAWYREVSEYNYNRPGFAMNTGHFTQVVWAGTTELGCGVAVCDGGETWVCNYSPPGNMQGSFPANVQPATCR